MEQLPRLFPTEVRTWFDSFGDPKNVQPEPKGQTGSLYRKVPPVTPQMFALPHQIGQAIGGTLPADRLPPLHKTVQREVSQSIRDVMEAPLKSSVRKSTLLSLLSIGSAEVDPNAASKAPHRSHASSRETDRQCNASLERFCGQYGPQQPVPTLLAAVPTSHTSSAASLFLMPPQYSAQPSSLFPGDSSTLIPGQATSPRPTSSDEVHRSWPACSRHPMAGFIVTPVILKRLDVRQPLLAAPPPGGWSGEAAMAVAMEEVRLAAEEEQTGEPVAPRRGTSKHGTAHRRTQGPAAGESRSVQREAKASKVVEHTAHMWRSRSQTSWRASGAPRKSTNAVAPKILGSHLGRGTPTPKTWMRRHGDQRVPLMLTVASNHMPYRLPPSLQEIIVAERDAAETAAVMAANPPPAPVVAVSSGVQDTGEAGDTQQLKSSNTCLPDSKGPKRGLLSQSSRCTSARSGVSDSSFLERNLGSSGSLKDV